MTFAIGGGAGRPLFDGLKALAAGSVSLSLAVSYIQQSGWDLLRQIVRPQARAMLRILCTDQFGITDPDAVRAIAASGAAIRVFTPGGIVFHPKVFIGHRPDRPSLFMLGSANLSRSALLTGVEVDVSGEDADGTLTAWFDDMFADPRRSAPFDDARLAALDRAFAARLKSRLVYQRAVAAVPGAAPAGVSNASAAVEAGFAGLTPGVTPLNFDKAGNNVRRLGIIADVLQGRVALKGKALSEMKLLGFAEGGQLNARGRQAARAGSEAAIAAIWMAWLKQASDAELLAYSPSGQLIRARAAFRAFWTFPAEVTDYFIAHAERPNARQKQVLQAIELLANSGRRLAGLGLEDVRTLSTVLTDTAALSPQARLAVHDYLDNKGARGWRYADRRIAVLAWRDAP